MTEKLDFKKKYKDLYLPGKKPELVQVPPILYLMVDGKGAPESDSYQEGVQILYTLAWTIKMSKMGGSPPMGYMEYVMPPLEGLWDLGAQGLLESRESWTWTSMIRQPEFVTPKVFLWACEQGGKKEPSLDFSRARLQVYKEDLCVQAMHTGPYSTEQETMEKLVEFLRENHLEDCCGKERRHHEIYLNDPRRTSPEKLKTVLRHPVENRK